MDGAARVQLMHDTLRRTVHALQTAALFQHICVVTLDKTVQRWARNWGVSVIHENHHGLNEALHEARHRFAQADAVLVVHGDVAWLAVEDVLAMAALAQAERAVVIAPDRHERGTNALLIKPAQLINFAFGEDSAQRHAALAKASGVQPLWYRSPSIGLDVDEALDLRMYEAAPFVLD